MKRLLIFAAFLAIAFTACLKNTTYYDDLTKTSPFVELLLSGKLNFGADGVTAAGDTITLPIIVNLASTNTSGKAISVTVAPDLAQVATYDKYDTTINYLPMPAAAFVFPATTVSIPAGKRQVKISVTFYKNLLDPAKSYMLPISITGATGAKISGNFATHYFHFIGNPLAGPVTYTYTRYNNASFTPPSNAPVVGPSVLSPVNPTTLTVATSYVGAVHYIITFTQTGNTYSNFKVSFNSDDVASIWTANGIKLISGPKIIQADPVKGTFEFQYEAQNSAGAFRTIDDLYQK